MCFVVSTNYVFSLLKMNHIEKNFFMIHEPMFRGLVWFFLILSTFCLKGQSITHIDSSIQIAHSYTTIQPEQALQISRHTLEMSQRTGYLKGIAESHNNMGIVYFHWGMYEIAMTSFYEAARNYLNARDIEGLSKALNNLGVVANLLKMHDFSLRVFWLSLHIQKKLGHYENVAELYNNIASIYTDLKQYNLSYSFLQKALKISDSLNITETKANVLNNLGVYFQYNQQFDTALYYYKKAFELTRDSFGNVNKYLFAYNVAFILEKQGHYEQAYSLLSDYLPDIEREKLLLYQAMYYDLISRILAARKSYDRAYNFLHHYVQIKEKMNSTDLGKRFTDMLTMLQQEAHKKELRYFDEKMRLRQKLQFALLWLLVIFLGIIIVLILYIRTKNKLMEQIRMNARLQLESMERQMFLEKERSRLEEEKLKAELSVRERELVSMSLNLASKNDFLNDFRNLIDHFVKKGELKKETDLYKNIQSRLNSNAVIDQLWHDFFLHFEKVYPSFFENLKKQCPELTTNDLKFCAYIKLQLSNKDLSRIYNVTEQSIKIKKNRLRKKLQLSSMDELSQFINSL